MPKKKTARKTAPKKQSKAAFAMSPPAAMTAGEAVPRLAEMGHGLQALISGR
jgi:hypothetical protein